MKTSYFKGSVYFNHKHGCQKCTIDGVYIGGRMTFPYSDCPLRSDHSFRSRLEPGHHRESFIIERLPIDMVKDFVIADSLHLLELGAMRRLIHIWKDGLKDHHEKWNKRDILELNQLLDECNKQLPKEIHRRFRYLEKLSFWKGTEYRSLLLYAGIVVLKKFLSSSAYVHFVTLFAATTICTTKFHRHLLPLAHQLFNDFIEDYGDLYGREHIVSNIHNLCHVVDDVKRFGELPKIGTYPYENKLRIIKLKLKQCNKVLDQAANRIIEESTSKIPNSSSDKNLKIEAKYPFKLPDNNMTFYKEIFCRDGFSLSIRTFGDMWFMTNTKKNRVFKFIYATLDKDNMAQIFGSPLHDQENFFDAPFQSSRLLIFLSNLKVKEKLLRFPVNDLKCKMVCFGFDDKYVLLPLLHTFEENE